MKVTKNINQSFCYLLLWTFLSTGLFSQDHLSLKQSFLAPQSLQEYLTEYSASTGAFLQRLQDEGITKKRSRHLLKIAVEFLHEGNEAVLNDLYSSRQSGFPAVKSHIIDKEAGTLSLVLFNNRIIRINSSPTEGFYFSFFGQEPYGNLVIDDWDMIQRRRGDFVSSYNSLIDNGLTLEEINDQRLLMIRDIGPIEEERPFREDEMLYIIASVNQALLDRGFQNEELVSRHADPIDMYLSLAERPYLTHDLRVLPRRVVELKTLFKTLNKIDTGFKIFLARDSLSAFELEHYYCSLTQVPQFSSTVYQPGLPSSRNSYHAGYSPEQTLVKTMGQIQRVFDIAKKEHDVEESLDDFTVKVGQKDRLFKMDEKEADPELYEAFKETYKQAYLEALKKGTNGHLRKESLLILRQLKRFLPQHWKKATVIDLHASGKTTMYIQIMIEVFSDPEIIEELQGMFKLYREYNEGFLDIEEATSFLGYGRGQNIGIPKLSHHTEKGVHTVFSDFPWSMDMEKRNPETGEVHFENNKKRHFILQQIYQSLLLFNAAFDLVPREDGGLGERDENYLTEEFFDENDHSDHITSLSHINSKSKFLKIYHRNDHTIVPGYLGKQRKQVQNKLNSWFGKDQWVFMYLLPDGSLISADTAVLLYEEAYEEHFNKNPEILKELIENYRDVYDISPFIKPVDIEFDGNTSDKKLFKVPKRVDPFSYDIISGDQVHLQDVAIRRIIRRKGLKFKGRKLLQIRSRKTEGYHLNPGVVPFHMPKLILSERSKQMARKWWESGSVEDFYQSNRIVVLKKDLPDFNIHSPSKIVSQSV